MMKDQNILPLHIYYQSLTEINGVKFTPREVDVISCILNGRTAAIAGFLLIGKRAVEGYISDIRKKAGGLTGRDQIIDFIEKSEKHSLIKNEYYSAMRRRVLFEEKIKEISKTLKIHSSTCLLVYEKNQTHTSSLIPYLKKHIKDVGFKVEICSSGAETFSPPNLDRMNHVLYVASQNLSDKQISQITTNYFYIDILDKKNYYLFFFELLKKLCPDSHFENIVEEFILGCESINEFSDSENVKGDSSSLSRKSFAKERKWHLLTTLIGIICLLGFAFFVAAKNPGIIYPMSTFSIRSDLIIPHYDVLLDRSDIIAELDKKLGKKGSIKTVAIVGTGGSGKTTLTRRYAHQQKENIIWEVNAETQESLKNSFEKLAQKLSRTERDQEELNNIQNTRDVVAREEKILEFVKEHLKLYSNWFLLYDNVENLIEIANYFPQDPRTWGEGKIIITTRNENIKNNGQINHVISLGELNQEQKRDLFKRIISFGSDHLSESSGSDEENDFLERIPPFPLDISVAAYYTKTTKIPYDDYLERMKQQDEEFAVVQKNLLKEAGTYLKTRYSIITLSLENIIKNHKDFADLFLFISILDSQNIPRDLLNKYKDKNIVDNFVYHLKKHSLITHEVSPATSESAFSLHRSAQAITLEYLRKKLDLKNNTALIQPIWKTLETYINALFENWNALKLKELTSHCEIFLSHDDLLNDSIKGSLSIKLGGIYALNYFNFSPGKTKKFLEKAMQALDKSNPKNYANIAQGLFFLGYNAWDFGDYEKCKFFIEKSIGIYKKFVPENQLGLARASTFFAAVEVALGHYEQSKNLGEQALSIYRQHYPETNVNIAWNLSFLGCSYYWLGYYEKSKEIHEKCLAIYKKYYPKNYMSICRIYVGLGLIHWRLKNSKLAKHYIEKSIAICKNEFSKTHYNMDCSLGVLGMISLDLHDYKKAREIFENGLVFREKHYGKNHFLTANTLRELGSLELVENNIEKADALLKRALSIYQETNHVEIYTVLESLADLYIKKSLMAKPNENSQGFKNKAIDYLKQALDVVITRISVDSPHRIPIEAKLKDLKK